MERDIIPLEKRSDSVPDDLYWTAETPKPITKEQYSCYLIGKHVEERKSYVLFSKLWRGLFDNYGKAKRYLDEHADIRQRKPSPQRIEVHAGDWFRHFARKVKRNEPSDEEIHNVIDGLEKYVDGVEQRKAEIARKRPK